MFCEYCGVKLPDDSNFCFRCGRAVAPIMPTGPGNPYIFSDRSWSIQWRRASEKAGALGIILTDTRNCVGVSAFKQSLDAYIRFKASRGVHYYVLDLADQQVAYRTEGTEPENVISVLKSIYSVIRPEYLMIVGDHNAIGTVKWKNRAHDSDSFVESDLPYISLDMQSPWEGQEYDFKNCVRVGRIPAQARTGFAEAGTYFANAMKSLPARRQTIHGFSLAAMEWDAVSRRIHKKGLPRGVYFTSPPSNKNDFAGRLPRAEGEKPNLLYFNLHGSAHTELWYGQDGSSYPEAFSAPCLNDLSAGYMLGTEACYGAKPVFGKNPTMVLHAMQNGCLAFLGSTQVAYGSVSMIKLCADVLVGEYIHQLSQGSTAGDAFLAGLEKLHRSPANTDSEIKTLAEFALYGDPSTALLRGGVGAKSAPAVRTGGYHVPMPDVRKAVELKLASVSGEISGKLNAYVKQNHGAFSHITPKYYEVSGYGGYQAMYSSDQRESILKVYFDRNGNVDKVCVSR